MLVNQLRLPKALLAAFIVALIFTNRTAAPVVEAADYDSEIALSETDFNATIDVMNANVTRNCTFKRPTQLSFFYKPASDTRKMIKKHDLLVLTKNDEPEMLQAKAAGVSPVLQYIRFDSIHDPCGQVFKPVGTPCSCNRAPNNNNVGWNPNDICNIRDNHPEWFLRDAGGNLIVINDMVVMDPGNAGWRNFWLSRLKESQPDGWQGIFMDNMGTKFFMHGSGDKALQKYPTIEAYQEAVYNFVSTVRSEYFAPNKRLMFGNVSVHWGHTPYFLRLMTQLDGSMDENWAAGKTDYYSVKSWEDRVIRAHQAIKQGNRMMLTTQGSRTDNNRQLFAFASYLLVASENTYFRYSHQDDSYDEIWLYDNYKFKLGNPTGEYFKKAGKNVWIRKFENGKVKVNPETRTAKIRLRTVC